MAERFQLKALITGVDKLSPMLLGVRKNAAMLRKQLNDSGLGKISFEDAVQGGAIAAPFVLGVKAAIDFESAMADVKKVVKFDTPEQFKAMGEDVLDLADRLPMAAEGIAKIVAAGGQSGIARDELAKFAEDAVKMGIAFDQTADESGNMMATWRTAFRMSQKEVVALADQINFLGSSGPVNTKQLSSIVTEVGALGEVAGFSSAQIAAIGATMVGVKQDVAATGIKNFMLAMTKGTAATKSQAEAFKSLRLDSKKVAEGMQKDSQGTMLDLLKRISQVDAAKRPALLTNLFGSESVAAITPLLTNLQLLKSNLASVGDSTLYAGSMGAEYAARAATTLNALQLLDNHVTRVGITLGTMLLPPLNEFLETIGPLVSVVGQFAGMNPWLVKGILGAAAGFAVLRLAAVATTAALALMNAVTTMSPIGLVVRGVALAAGLLIANWATVAPFFESVWEKIKGPAIVVWGWMKAAFAWSPLGRVIENWGALTQYFVELWDAIQEPAAVAWGWLKRAFEWSPLGLIVANWQPLTELFAAIWDLAKALSVPFFGFLKRAFEWSPIGLVVSNWGPISELFGALWEVIKAMSVPFIDFMKAVFDWSPLGLLIKHWEPITAYFTELWGKLQPIIEPMLKFMGFESAGGAGVLQTATAAVKGWTAEQNAINAGEPSPGSLMRPIAQPPQLMPEATRAASLLRMPASAATPAPLFAGSPVRPSAELMQPAPGASLVTAPSMLRPEPGDLPAARGSLVQQAAGNKAKLEGSMLIRFEGAPAGMRVDKPETNQPGLTVTPQVGYRTLGRGAP